MKPNIATVKPWPDTLAFDCFTRRQKTVFLTHAHTDHMGGLTRPRKTWPWRILCSQQTRDLAQARCPHVPDQVWCVMPVGRWQPLPDHPGWQCCLIPSWHCQGSQMIGLCDPTRQHPVLYTGDMGNTTRNLPEAQALFAQLPPLHLYFDDTYVHIPPARLPTLESTQVLIKHLQHQGPVKLHWSQLGTELVWPEGPGPAAHIDQHAFSAAQLRLLALCSPRHADIVNLGKSNTQGATVLVLTCHTSACPGLQLKKPVPPGTRVMSIPFCMHPSTATLRAWMSSLKVKSITPLGFALDPDTCRFIR